MTGPYLQMLCWDYVPYVPSLKNTDYLFSFVGSTRTHEVRRRVMSLKHARAFLKDTSVDIAKHGTGKSFAMVDHQSDDKTYYGDIISRSKFVLCPRGYACSTWRLFETLKAGRVPVIISDQWVPPQGPDWERFSVRIKESEVAVIPEVLERYESEAELMGRQARTAWDEWFSKETVFHRIIEWCLRIQERTVHSPVADLAPYAQLLRPYFVRHVILPEVKHRVLKL